MNEKAVVIFSGGPDSTAAALWSVGQGYDVELVTYQLHNERQYGELRAAMLLAVLLGLPHKIIDFKSPLHVFPPTLHVLMHSGIREKQEPQQQTPYLLPFGSGILLSFTAAYAIDNEIKHIVWGATKDDTSDNSLYSSDFATKLAALISQTTGEPITIHTPLYNKHKYEVISDVNSSNGALLKETWSCVEGQRTQCGKCPPCTVRRLAFAIAGVQDQTSYVTNAFNNPLTDQQMKDIHNMSPEEREKLLIGRKKNC